ncbi:uncharacterized protein LOC100909064 [Galendromus occidentalis]|uniref:Uncharacterized protein LOC100909064 n=1 Tax=Galendromus occidentalis TaxID=34638 RepID=A0AAJ7SEU6_9ACAR|nr:uncharacterized protein LOC100909064 [Galendromus occidentalis]
MFVTAIISSTVLLTLSLAQPVDQNYLNSITHKQLANRYKVPQFDIGMPRYNLRYGYLIFGSPYLRCNNEKGRYSIQRGNSGDYPHCLFPNGLVNTPPFTKHPHHLWGDGWGTDAVERENPFNKAENYVMQTANRHAFG